jgi:glycosyltransferase involved in cell wall biosynthesis
MACELPCIVTDHSGLREFATEENCFLIRVEAMRGVHDPRFYNTRYEWGEWAQPDLAHLRSLMRFVYENSVVAQGKARRAREDAVRLWGWDRAAQTAMAHVVELRARS